LKKKKSIPYGGKKLLGIHLCLLQCLPGVVAMPTRAAHTDEDEHREDDEEVISLSGDHPSSHAEIHTG